MRVMAIFKGRLGVGEHPSCAPSFFGYHIGGYYSYLARESQNYSIFEAFAPPKKKDCIRVLKRERDIMIILPYKWGNILFIFAMRARS